MGSATWCRFIGDAVFQPLHGRRCDCNAATFNGWRGRISRWHACNGDTDGSRHHRVLIVGVLEKYGPIEASRIRHVHVDLYRDWILLVGATLCVCPYVRAEDDLQGATLWIQINCDLFGLTDSLCCDR